jgi:hypothetical protein
MTNLSDELQLLRQKLVARENRPGYKRNVVAIKQRIAAIENNQTPAISEPQDAA